MQLIKKLGRISKARLASALSGLLPSPVVCMPTEFHPFVLSPNFSPLITFLPLLRIQSTPAKKSLPSSTGKESAAAAVSTTLSLSPRQEANSAAAADSKEGTSEFSQFTPSPRVARASSSLSASNKTAEAHKKPNSAHHAATIKSRPAPAAASAAPDAASMGPSATASDSAPLGSSSSAPRLEAAHSVEPVDRDFENHNHVSAAAFTPSVVPTAFVSLLDRSPNRSSAMTTAPSFEPAPAHGTATLFYPTASASAWPMAAPFQQPAQPNADIADMLHRLNQRMEEVREGSELCFDFR
jgi:hypothetical protein